MVEQAPGSGETPHGGGSGGDADSVVIRANPATAIPRAMATSPVLAVTALIAATVTMLTMSAATDIATAHLYSKTGVEGLSEIRWAASVRLMVAGLALLLAIFAGIRYAHELPATRYDFSPDGEDADESVQGTPPARWVTTLVGSAFAVSLLAVALNVIALAVTLHLHESPNFGFTSNP